MFGFIKRLFSRKQIEIPEAVYPELYWDIPLSEDISIFPLSDSEDFAVSYRDAGIELSVNQANKFVWQEIPAKVFGNFVLDADIELPSKPNVSDAPADFAAGFVFRLSNSSTFMFLGLSNKGNIRLDVLINGEPRALTGWVACPWLGEKLCNILLIARDDHYTVYANGKFALEAEDDTIREGLLGVSMQVFSSSTPITAVYRNISIESRPVEVEVAYSRFTNMLARGYPEQRRRLVESFMSIGSWVPALIQLKRIEESSTLLPEDRFRRAECCIREQLYAEARQELELIDRSYERYDEARLELFHVLYMSGAYEELKAKVLESGSPENPQHCNVLGHAYFNLGNFSQALESYKKAYSLEPTMPLYAMNAARSAEHADKTEEAMRLWYEAADLFYSQEAYTDTRTCMKHLKALGAEVRYLLSIEGRIAYAEDNFRQAELCFRKLEQERQLDPGSAYLLGMIMRQQKKQDQALRYFETALQGEAENPLYHFRYAESLWLAGKAFDAALASALPYAEACGWIYNLAGLAASKLKNGDEAISSFQNAVRCLPEETVPILNLADALSSFDRQNEAKALLEAQPESPVFLNALGNVHAKSRNTDKALACYNRALEISETEDEVYCDILYNRASCYAERGLWGDAQDDLRKALAVAPDDIRSLVLTGDIWNILGDPVRGELSWLHALQMEPENLDTLERLGKHYIQYGKQKKLNTILEATRKLEAKELEKTLTEAWENKLYTKLACASCDRIWKVPRTIPVSAAPIRLHGELPDELPAGKCPQCGAYYCVGCAKEHLEDGRFVCPSCSVRLVATDPEIRYIFQEWLKNQSK